MNTNLNDYKERVKRLRKAVTSVLNIECSQSQAYELLAKEENYPNWDTLSGVINKIEEIPKNTLSVKEQIAQLFLIHQGLMNGCPLMDILPMLKELKNPIIANAWSNVKIDHTKNYSDMFFQTNFFDDEVLAILKMGAMVGSLEGSIKSAIEFLKLDLN